MENSEKITNENLEEEILELTEDVPKNIVKPLVIYPYQREHLKEMLKILEENISCQNNSCFGSGKTIVTIAIAAARKMGILVVGPKTVLPTWEKNCKLYGVHLYSSMTYSALRGTEKGGVKHDLLEREGDEYFPTKVLEECAKKGVLIVYDECHYLKNEKSQQLEAAHALSREAVRLAYEGHNIRIAALSATPADKKENISSLLKILGIINAQDLYRYDRSSKKYISIGLQEVVNKCDRYDPDTTFHILCRPLNKTNSKLICYELYTRILKKHITSSMPEPPIEAQKDVKNLFAIMPPKDVERLKKGALLFSSATSYKPETSEIDLAGVNWGDVIRSRREIDSAKVATMVRLAKKKLDKNPKCKVILYYTFKRDMIEAAELLKKYNPLIMNGDVLKTEDRVSLMEKFQRHDNVYRVFISNPKVGGLGIELDDKYGDQRRYMYLAPSYMFIDQFQATGRIHRKETKSKATIRFIYSRDFPLETGILNSIAEKSRVARDMILENQTNVIFPGEIEDIIEKTEQELEEEEI